MNAKLRLDADVVIVGAGVAGATLAKELASKKRKVIVVEKGEAFKRDQFGTEIGAYNFYDRHGLWSKSKEGIFYYRAIMTGGTSTVSCGNAVRSLESRLKKSGINISSELRQTERELGVSPVPERLMGKGTRIISGAARNLGYKMSPMPKLVNFKKCVSCGNCILGCKTGAKWSAQDFLDKGIKKGANLITNTEINGLIICRGKIIGVEGRNKYGNNLEIFAPTVVLCAGGLGTPVILQNAGIKAGQRLFLDLFTVTFGLNDITGNSRELTMATVYHGKDFILSPFIDNPVVLVSVVPVDLRRELKMAVHKNNLLGIMVKIKDSDKGCVNFDGSVEKKLTAQDKTRLKNGQDMARKILIKAGVDPSGIITTKIRGAHPGGTAAIGRIVDKDLQTIIKGLYVCDASVLPEAPGLPPILTIVALSKRLAGHIDKE